MLAAVLRHARPIPGGGNRFRSLLSASDIITTGYSIPTTTSRYLYCYSNRIGHRIRPRLPGFPSYSSSHNREEEEEEKHKKKLQDIIDQVDRQAQVDLESKINRKFANIEALLVGMQKTLREAENILESMTRRKGLGVQQQQHYNGVRDENVIK